MMKNEFERTINASDLQEWIMCTFPDWCEGDVRLIYDHIDDMPSAQHNVHDFPKDADCISRQQAIDTAVTFARRTLLDSKPIDVKMSSDYIFANLVEPMRKLPSAQPEIIRCKDCKNWEMTWTNDFSPNYHYCPMVDGTRRDDFYCADAERRANDCI